MKNNYVLDANVNTHKKGGANFFENFCYFTRQTRIIPKNVIINYFIKKARLDGNGNTYVNAKTFVTV